MNPDQAKKIICIGDIHIFNSKRFAEHLSVFKELYSVLEDEKPDLILILGDTIDSKIRLSPEQIDICRSLFIRLSKFCPIIIIPGNHDVQLNNADRLDSISPIIHSIQKEKVNPIYYFKHSGLYSKFGVQWAVWSCIDDQLNPFVSNNDSGEYTIGLYHGVIKGAKNSSGFEIGGGIDIAEFIECNQVVAADIHKQQFFRNGEIAYTGSLIQVNVDEEPDGSYLVYDWNGTTYDTTVKRLTNIYSTVSVNVNEKVPALLPTQKVRVKFDVESHTRSSAIEFAKKIKAQHNVEVDLLPVVNKSPLSYGNVATNKITSNNLIDYFKEFIASNAAEFGIVDLQKDTAALLRYDVEFSKGDVKIFDSGDFDIYKLVINNFLSFSDAENVIDLDMDGLIGIIGKNRSGKSTIIKAVQFVLFNEMPNNSSAIKMINKFNKSKPAYVEIYFTKNGTRYKIRRTITADKKLSVCRLDLSFEEIDDIGNVINNFSKESRPHTEKEIQRYLGINETFEMLSIFSAQKRQVEFIDCKNSDRLKLVHKFLGLQPFELKEENVKDILKEKNAVYNTLMAELNKNKSISVVEKDIVKTEILLKFDKSQETELLDELEDIESGYKEVNEIYASNQRASGSVVIDVNEFNNKIVQLEKENAQYRNLIVGKRAMVDQMRGEIANEKTMFELSNGPISEYDSVKSAKAAVIEKSVKSIAVIEHEIQKAKSQLNIDSCNTCGKKFTDKDKERILESISSLDAERDSIAKASDVVREEIKYAKEWLLRVEDVEKIAKDIERYQIIKIENTIKNNELEISRLKSKISEYEKVTDARLIVNLLKDKVAEYYHDKNSLNSKIKDVRKNISSYEMKLASMRSEVKVYVDRMKTIDSLTEEIRLLRIYKKIVDKDGLPLFMLMSKISEINDRINTIIEQIFDFTVEFKVDDKKGELKIQFNYEGDPEHNDVALASGSETFMINLCIKVALAQISILPKVQTLFIDEGYDSLDKETIEKLPDLFNILSNYYKNIITISHMDEIKDLCNKQIKISKSKRYTEVA